MEKLKFAKVRDVKSPCRAHPEDAGIDFFVPEDALEVSIDPGESVLIPSGIRAQIPEGWALIAYNKSGVATKQGLGVGACVCDAGYEGEIHIHLFNHSMYRQHIKRGQKIVQFIMVPVGGHMPEEISLEQYEQETKSERGTGGFGSSGV